MSTYVLVHGAWQTAATWDLITPILRAEGHNVLTPPLSGLEQDGIALSSAVTLQTHIDDVVGVVERQDLDDVILVGHSYAGMVITGVAERTPHRVNRLIYADAFVPLHGQSALDLLPETVATLFRQQAHEDGDGWRLPASDAQLDMWGLRPGHARDFVRARLSDFSLRCFEEPIKLPANSASRMPRIFIASVGEGYPARPVFQPFAERARREGWDCRELPAGHDSHVEMPDAFAAMLKAPFHFRAEAG